MVLGIMVAGMGSGHGERAWGIDGPVAPWIDCSQGKSLAAPCRFDMLDYRPWQDPVCRSIVTVIRIPDPRSGASH